MRIELWLKINETSIQNRCLKMSETSMPKWPQNPWKLTPTWSKMHPKVALVFDFEHFWMMQKNMIFWSRPKRAQNVKKWPKDRPRGEKLAPRVRRGMDFGIWALGAASRATETDTEVWNKQQETREKRDDLNTPMGQRPSEFLWYAGEGGMACFKAWPRF